MKGFFIASILLLVFTFPLGVWARVTPNDIYQANQAQYQAEISKISDPTKHSLVEQARMALADTNLMLCARLDVDVARMGAIMEELKRRHHIISAVVAYGQGATPADSAEYSLNFAEEALAYQKSQDYTPGLSVGPKEAILDQEARLEVDQTVLVQKILLAKQKVGAALNYYEK